MDCRTGFVLPDLLTKALGANDATWAELEVLVLWTPARRGCGTNRSEPQPRRDDAPTKATNGAPCPDIKVRGQVVKPRIRRKGDFACFRQVTVVCPCPRPIGRVAHSSPVLA